MPAKNLLKRLSYQNHSRGFGLIELLVSISVMVLVTSIIMARHDSFNGATLLRGQAYEVALAIREMQLLAVSAAKGASGFNNVYGLVFNTAQPNRYSIFADANTDYVLNGGEEVGKQGVIDPRFEIGQIRLMAGIVEDSTPGDITILFKRPNFDALLYEEANNPVDDDISSVEIDIKVRGTAGSGPGEVRTIEITRSGQITVQDIP